MTNKKILEFNNLSGVICSGTIVAYLLISMSSHNNFANENMPGSSSNRHMYSIQYLDDTLFKPINGLTLSSIENNFTNDSISSESQNASLHAAMKKSATQSLAIADKIKSNLPEINYGGLISDTLIAYWIHAYGTGASEEAYSVQQTSDGGYIVAGSTSLYGGDMWTVKLDSSANIMWQKRFGQDYQDIAYSIQQTSDNGYIVGGSTFINMSGRETDIWIMKLDSTGGTTWSNWYGGIDDEWANFVQQTSDGGYIVAGTTYSFGTGGRNIWVSKLNSAGSTTWQKTYGIGNADDAYFIQQTSDGGYIIAGSTYSAPSGYDMWILKLDSTGNVTWQKSYGGTSADYARSIKQTSDNGYIIAGSTSSSGAGGSDVWVIKVDSAGTISWQNTYGGTNNDAAYAVLQDIDGSYIIAGQTNSFGAGLYDFWVLKLDGSGNIIWQKTYGGPLNDYARSVIKTSDGSFVVAGSGASFGSGVLDFWVLKIDSSGNAGSCSLMNNSSAIFFNSNATVVNTSSTVLSPPSSSESIFAYSSYTIGVDTMICQSSPPGAVPDNDNYPGTPLTLSKSGTNLVLAWGAPGGTCQTQNYGIYRGTLPWSGYNHSSVTCSTGGATTATIATETNSYYYLIVAQNFGNEGSYGLDSSNIQRPASSTPCLAQQIGSCN